MLQGDSLEAQGLQRAGVLTRVLWEEGDLPGSREPTAQAGACRLLLPPLSSSLHTVAMSGSSNLVAPGLQATVATLRVSSQRHRTASEGYVGRVTSPKERFKKRGTREFWPW